MATARVAAPSSRAETRVITAEKARWRRRLKERRRALGPDRARLSRLAAWRAMSVIPVDRAPAVAIFWSLADEIDTSPLRQILEALNLPIGLPRMTGREQPLTFHAWRTGEPLIEGPMGVQEPAADAPSLVPDVMILPLLGFDRQGYRLGYGGGFYDRTLAERRATGRPLRTIGFAFDGQRLDAVPRGPEDEPIDIIVTDAQIYRRTP